MCNATTNLTLFDDSGTAIENTSCISSDNNPGQVLFGTSTSGTNIAAGTIIEAEVPVYLIYETADSDDEHNLLGL